MSVEFTPPENRNRYPAIDGLRAYSAIGIVLMHVLANLPARPTDNFLTATLIPWCTDLTLLFMVVSGFSMCCGYYDRIKSGSITPDEFYRRRYGRILPFFALLCLADLSVSRSWTSCADLFANLTLCFNLLPQENISMIGVGWFLGVVFLFYLFFPFFVFMIDNKRRAVVSFVASTALAGIATVYTFNPTIAEPEIGRTDIVYVMPLFLAGGLVYLWRDSLGRAVSCHRRLAAVVVLASATAFFAFPAFRSSNFGHLAADMSLFAIFLVYSLGSTDIVLNNRLVRFISSISMEVYLCHMLVYRVIERVHIERLVADNNAVYCLTAGLTLCGAVAFSYIAKRQVLPPLMARAERLCSR